MRKVSINNIESGSRLGKTIYNAHGSVLLSAGIELNEKYIKRLASLGITDLYIEDGLSEGIVIEDVVSDQTRREAKTIVCEVLKNASASNSVDREKVRGVARKLVQELLANGKIMINLMDIKSTDGYTYEHCVNVCILSVIMGIGLGYDIPSIEELAMGAILHDIGKIKIPNDILNKPDKLTEDEYNIIKQHTVFGYQILKNSGGFSLLTRYIALMHHERVDGSGYPVGIEGEKLHKFAKIVNVADVYDAMTSDRIYRPKLPVFKAVDYLSSMSSQQFDSDVVNCFLRYVAVYPVGTGVVLNNNMKGLVMRVNSLTTRPVVRIIYDENGDKLNDFYEINLMEIPDLYVVDTCEL